jgi:hypothetical protein
MDTKKRITVQVLNGGTGEVREVVAKVAAETEQDAVNALFSRARRDDYYYRFLGMDGLLTPDGGTPVTYQTQTYWALEA